MKRRDLGLRAAAGFALVLALGAPAFARIPPAAPAIVHPAIVHPTIVHPAVAPIVLPPPVAIPAPIRISVPIVLPPPPVAANTASNALMNALLAIDRASLVDPQAAQMASFAYVKALQQYRAGDLSGANRSAVQAFATAGAAQVRPVAPIIPAPALAPVATQRAGTAGGLYGADAPAIDADSFLALARGIIADCTARHDRRLPDAKAHFARAEHDFAARDWQATRADAKAAIDACAEPNQES